MQLMNILAFRNRLLKQTVMKQRWGFGRKVGRKVDKDREQIEQQQKEKEEEEQIRLRQRQQLSRDKNKMSELMEGRYARSELDQILDQKILQGKSDKEILKELVNMPKNEKRQKYIVRDKELLRQRNMGLIELLNMDSENLVERSRKGEVLELNQIQLDHDKYMSRQMKQIVKEQEQELEVQQMKWDTQQQPLELEPIKVMYGMGARTQLQKDTEQRNMAIIETDVMEMGEMPPLEYLKRKRFEEKVYEYFTDEQIEQLRQQEQQQQQQQEQQGEQQKQQMMKRKKQMEVDQYKQKMEKNQEKNSLSIELKQQALIDQQKGDDLIDNRLELAEPGDRYLNKVEKNPDQKQQGIVELKEEKIEELMEMFDEEEDNNHELMEYVREVDLKGELKRIEEEEKHKRWVERRERNKKIKKIYKEIESRDYNQDMDYEQEVEKVDMKQKQDKQHGGFIPDMEQMEKIEKTQQFRYDNADQSYEYHRIRTTNNYKRFFQMYLFDYNKSSIKRLCGGMDIALKEVITNNALTVCYVFWDFEQMETMNERVMAKDKYEMMVLDKKYVEIEEKKKKLVPIIEKNLQKYSRMIRGKLCQKVGMKYAPDVRFIKSQRSDKLDDVIEEFRQQIPDIVKSNLKEEYEEKKKEDPDYKQYISDSQFKAMCDEEFQEFIFNVNDQFEHQQQLQGIRNSKRYARYDKNGKRMRNNRNADGSKKKGNKRKRMLEKLWDRLD